MIKIKKMFLKNLILCLLVIWSLIILLLIKENYKLIIYSLIKFIKGLIKWIKRWLWLKSWLINKLLIIIIIKIEKMIQIFIKMIQIFIKMIQIFIKTLKKFKNIQKLLLCQRQ
jgi:hypothetical protein